MQSSSPLYPLSSVQREIWFEQTLYPEVPLYNVGNRQWIPGPLNRALFEQAIDLLVQEADVLRMVLTVQDGVPFQSFPEMSRARLVYRDMSAEANPREAALAEIRRDINRPFRFFEEPLFRFTLFKLSEASHIWSGIFHHLLLDGASLALLLRRCGAIYSALLRGEAVPARPGVPYADFIQSDLSYLASESYQRHRQYWQGLFSSLPEPLFCPRTLSPSHTGLIRGSTYTWALSRARYTQLEALAKAHSVTLFHALLGLLYVLFTRIQDRDECVIGLPVLNRNTHAFKQSFGLYSSVIPARFGHGRKDSFVGLMQSIAKTLREAYRCQRFPMSEISRMAGVYKVGRKRLFDLSLSFITSDFAADFGPGNTSHGSYVNNDAEQLPLAVYVGDYSKDGDIQVDFSYNLAYFTEDEMRGLQGRLLHLIDEVLENPRTSIGKLDILLPEEKTKLLYEWSGLAERCEKRGEGGKDGNRHSAQATGQERGVHQAFEEQARNAPDATALIFEEETLTYAELNARANRLARTLIARGLVPEDRVAIALERSTAMIVALLATLKAGGAAVPLDPDYPEWRLAFMLANSGAKLLLTVESLRGRFADSDLDIYCLDTEVPISKGQADDDPSVALLPGNLAYVIYTSGSTGKPKGVAVEHGSLSLHCRIVSSRYELGIGSRILLFASFSFDTSIEEILATLSSGATLVVPSPGLPTPEYIDATVRRLGLTVLSFPPAFFRLWAEHCRANIPATLRLIVIGGDVLTPDLLSVRAKWPKPWPRLLNAYGPTECTVTSTIYEVPESLSGSSVPIGRPLSYRTHYILDGHSQPTPIGIPGELHIGGDCLARGYLNQPELTAEKFIPDPFDNTPGARLYKTGDQVRYLPDGNIEFLGRLDHQVKIRGFRIELGEIEASLVTHPSVREAVVVPRKAENGAPCLIAYLVAAQADTHASDSSANRVPSTGELRSYLQTRLPDYMLPAAFVYLPTIPLTPNGKVDRNGLPEPAPSILNQDRVATGDALEEIISGLWSNLLHRPSPGLHDNFFELGGHSLIATQFSSRMHDALGLTIPVRWIFEAPTISELAARIRSMMADRTITKASLPPPPNLIAPGTARITPDLLPLIALTQSEIDQVTGIVEGGAANVQDIYPITQLQGGILYHYLLNPGGNLYVGLALFALDTRINSQSFVSALQTIINRHDILRSSIVWRDLTVPVQVVWRQASLKVETPSFSPEGGPIADQLLHHGRKRLTSFDLTKAPLLRVILAEDGERSFLILLGHHLIMDNMTLDVIIEELEAILQGNLKGLPPSIPFRNFVVDNLRAADTASSEAFFRNMLGDIETATVPFGLLDMLGTCSEISLAKESISLDLSNRLRTQVRKIGATPAALFHLAWALVLCQLCKQGDVVFGTVLMGRMQGGKGIERAVGLFLNTLPIRVCCTAKSVIQALRDTQQGLIALMHHEHASLGLAQRCSKLSAGSSLFTSLLNFRQTPPRRSDANRQLGYEIVCIEDRNNFPLCLSIDDMGTDFRLTIEVDAPVNSGDLCTLMRHTVSMLVKALEEAPQTPLCDCEVPLPGRIQMLLSGNQATALSFQQGYAGHSPNVIQEDGPRKRRQLGRL